MNPANDIIDIIVTDEPGAGGANHVYECHWADPADNTGLSSRQVSLHFQNGPIAENGVNGITQEVLLEIVADRLRSFQAGPFSSRENAVALTHIETAQLWLHKRTLDRMARCVEGTTQK